METLSRLQKSCEEKLEKITKLENLIVEKQAKLEKLEYVNDLKLEVLDLEIKDGSLNKELLLLEKEIKKEEEKHEMLLEKSNKILMAKEGLQDMVLNIVSLKFFISFSFHFFLFFFFISGKRLIRTAKNLLNIIFLSKTTIIITKRIC